jgi:hypothetical protein
MGVVRGRGLPPGCSSTPITAVAEPPPMPRAKRITRDGVTVTYSDEEINPHPMPAEDVARLEDVPVRCLVADRPSVIELERPVARPGLAADDDPVDPPARVPRVVRRGFGLG